MPGLQVHLLGAPRVACDDTPVVFARRKSLALLAYLAASNQVHSRDTLAALFWPELDSTRARTDLRHALSELNRQLGPGTLTIEQDQVGLAGEARLNVDVVAFRRLLTEVSAHGHPPGHLCNDCLANLDRAANLYRGDFLAGFSLADCPEFDTWQTLETENLRLALAAALEAASQGHTARGAYGTAITYARRWLALDRLCEPAHRGLMHLHAANGDRAAALRQYDECVRTLADELGIQPEPETTRLAAAIRAGGDRRTAQPVPAPSPTNLPAEPTPFVGRENELAQVAERLADPACRLLTITGPGGIGKSRLALAAAAAQVRGFPDGVFYVELTPLNDVHLLPAAILNALPVPPAPLAEPREQLLHFVRDRQLLLVLDNFEHLLAGAELLPELLAVAPRLKLLATSRLRLNLREEWLVPLGGLDVPPDKTDDGIPLTAATLEDHSATRLFLQCARRLLPGYRAAADAPEITAICRLLAGMPLGIELAAARARTLPLTQIASDLTRRLDLLSTTLRDVPPRQRSMAACFDHSWRLLSGEERSILRRLSVFRGGFTWEAAASVAGATLADLSELVDASWLRLGAGGRYEMHELILQYCGGKLESEREAGETADQVRARHAACCISLAPEGDPWTRGLLVVIRPEIGNILAAWEWAIAEGQVEIADRLLDLVNWGSTYGGRGISTAMRICDVAAARLDARPDLHQRPDIVRLLARIELVQTGALVGVGFYERGLAAAEKAAALDPDGLGFWFRQIALALSLEARGQFVEAAAIWQELAALAPLYHRDLAYYIQNQGFIAWYRGRYDEARRYMEKAVGTNERGSLLQSYSSWCLGLMLYTTGDYRRAGQLAGEAAAICESQGDLTNAGEALWVAGMAAAATGRYTEAHEHLRRSLTLARATGFWRSLVWALNGFGAVELALGRTAEARRLYEESLALFDRPGAARAPHRVDALTGLGHAALAERNIEQAKAHFREGLGPCPRTAWETVHAIAGLAEAVRQEGQAAHAVELLTLVIEQPATWQVVRDRGAKLLKELEAELPAESFAAAVARGHACTLEDVVADLAL